VQNVAKALPVLAWFLFLPTTAFAQASITGVVKDTSGAVMPGVTVEASSPVLIERIRSAVTDGTGQFRIVDLRPGIYTVTFTLPGFSVVRRQDIELTGSFTATVNAEMKVGALAETVTVAGESPVVDTQSVRRQTTIGSEMLISIPTARSWAATAVLIPAIVTQSGAAADLQVTPQMTVFGGSGGRANEGRMQVDGLNTGASLNGGGVSTYLADIANAQEVSLTTSGGLGEAEVGGPTLSIVPKTGGNTIKGSFFAAAVSSGMVGSNDSDALRVAGLATPGKLLKLWDVTGGIGGPIRKDRLWFYLTARDEGQYRSIPGIYPNKNAGDPTKFLYEPDMSGQARGAESWTVATLRLTLQASSRNKFNVYWDEQHPCNGATYSHSIDGCRRPPESGTVIGALGLGGLTATTSPETSGYLHFGQRAQQVTWSSPVTNRLLLEAGMGTYLSRWGPVDTPGNPTRPLARMQEQCTAGCPSNGNIPGLLYRSANWASNWNGTYTWRASAAYVTGAHSMKFGLQGGFLVDDRRNATNDLNLQLRVNNGIPNLITESFLPYDVHQNTRYDALYGQEQWTHGRMTLQGALRFDRASSHFPSQTIGPSNYLPFSTTFPRTEGINGYKDITPRAGLAYDVAGTGKTSMKVNIGKYLEPASNGNGNYSIANPVSRVPGGLGQPPITRAWTDANRNFMPDCDLVNVAAQDLTASGGDVCGALSDLNFGRPIFSNNVDAALLAGWGIRPTDWQLGVSVQHEVLPRVSVEIGYFRRWMNNFTVTDNRAVGASDFTAFSVTAPADPRLPGGGGYTVSGLYNLVPAKFGQTDNFVTDAAGYGTEYMRYGGMLVNIGARPRSGLTLQGGINTGKTVRDNCEIRAELPELTTTATGGIVSPVINPTNPFCHEDPGFITRVTGLGSYVIPKVNVQFAATFRSDQGGVQRADWNASNRDLAPFLGRSIAGGLQNLTINLVVPGQVWGDRVNEFDLRISKILRFGRTRTNVGVDIFNVLNSAAVLTYNQTFVPGVSWLAPTSVLTPRFVKISSTIDF
jgi:hypothetical protein